MHRTAGACLIRVPATTANLGPGFDVLGLSLDLYNEVVVERLTGGWESGSWPVLLEIRGEGAAAQPDELPRGGDNLLTQALLAGWRRWQPETPLPPIRLTCNNRVPLGSGLGSSSTAVAAGLLTAAWLAGKLPAGTDAAVESGNTPVSTSPATPASMPAPAAGPTPTPTLFRPRGILRDILDLGVGLEGHPDNLVAALFGGLAVAAEIERRSPDDRERPDGMRSSEGGELQRDCREWVVGRVVPAGELWAAVVTPRFALRTTVSRSVLPEQVSRKDALFNLAQLSWLLLAAAAGDWREVGAAMSDRLHQPYRVPLVPGLEEVLVASRAAGAWGAALSGSGPSVVALTPDRAAAETVAGVMQETFAAAGVDSRAMAVRAGVPGALALVRVVPDSLHIARG